MSATDGLVANNASYVAGFTKGSLPLPPAKKVPSWLAWTLDAHAIRNAGGVASDDALRSLVISQRLLGTEEIILVHHTDCGMETFRDDAVKEQILADTGLRPSFALEAFPKADDDVKQTAARIKANPFIPHKNVRGFVYEVESGRLREIFMD
jgi:carbonic anhydrase